MGRLLIRIPMLNFLTPFFCLFLLQLGFAQSNTTISMMYSEQVKDSFEIYTSSPVKFDSDKTYNVVYYLDATLKSGKKLRELIHSSAYAEKTATTIFVGIGHVGNYHVLRRRDFILPIVSNADSVDSSSNYGQIDQFYQFMKVELIPTINAKFKTNPENNSIIGHSLGGLFVVYSLFKNELLFKSHYAFSPSLWIGNDQIYAYNQLGVKNQTRQYFYFSVGGYERFNHIKKGTERLNRFLSTKNYPNLIYQYVIQRWKTHNSHVEQSFDEVLKQKI